MKAYSQISCLTILIQQEGAAEHALSTFGQPSLRMDRGLAA